MTKSERAVRARSPASASSAAERAPSAFGTTPIVARLVAIDERGQPWVTRAASEMAPGADDPRAGEVVAARSTVPLTAEAIGREVLVCCTRDGRAVILGVLLDLPARPQSPESVGTSGFRGQLPEGLPLRVSADGHCVALEAEREIVLRCGPASVTLTSDGRVTIRGVDVVSSAERTHRIRGGAVRIN